MVVSIKFYFSGPAAVAIWLKGSAAAYRMPGSIQGNDLSTVSSVLYIQPWIQRSRELYTIRKENDEQEWE